MSKKEPDHGQWQRMTDECLSQLKRLKGLPLPDEKELERLKQEYFAAGGCITKISFEDGELIQTQISLSDFYKGEFPADISTKEQPLQKKDKIDPKHCSSGKQIARNYPEDYFG